MKPIEIKICGLTRRSDVALAAQAGASSLGFVFAESARKVTAEFVASCESPPQVSRVGVFADAPLEQILFTTRIARLQAVQLHGHESIGFLQALKVAAPELVLIRAVKVTIDEHELRNLHQVTDVVLFDSPRSVRRTLDVETLKRLRPQGNFWIAGGLSSENVRSFVETLNPDGVDVSSGVEDQLGQKSERRMREFVDTLRGDHYASR